MLFAGEAMQKFWLSQQDSGWPAKSKIMSASTCQQLVEKLRNQPSAVEAALQSDTHMTVAEQADDDDMVVEPLPSGIQAYLGSKQSRAAKGKGKQQQQQQHRGFGAAKNKRQLPQDGGKPGKGAKKSLKGGDATSELSTATLPTELSGVNAGFSATVSKAGSSSSGTVRGSPWGRLSSQSTKYSDRR